MMPMSGARSPRFRPRSRVLSRRSRSQTTNPLKLEDRDYRAQLARAEASVAAQRSALANIDANRRMHKAVIEQASAAVAGAAAELARAKYDFDRYRTLSTDQFASRQRFEQADADHEKARAAERRARAALDAAERQLDVIATQKQQTQAALDQALAERDLALLNLAYTEVRSPIDGVVGNRSATGNFTKIVQRVPVRIELEDDGDRHWHLRLDLSHASVPRPHARLPGLANWWCHFVSGFVSTRCD